MKSLLSRSIIFLPGLLAACLAIAGLSSCQSTPQASGPRFEIELIPGEYYRTTTRWFLFDIPIYPQAAVWAESLDGRYLGTLYVTAKGESQNWQSAPEEGRPEALPVWTHLRQGDLDAVAGATPSAETRRESGLAGSLPAGKYRIMLETNRSYDYNKTYTLENSGVTGQPSLVYQAELDTSLGVQTAVFQPIGMGAVDGSDGNVKKGLEGIDTALSLFAKMQVHYRE